MIHVVKKIFSFDVSVILISLLFVVPIIDSSNFFNGIISSKVYSYSLLMTILIGYNIILFFIKKQNNKIMINNMDFALGLFVIWNLFSAAYTQSFFVNNFSSELVLLTIYYFLVKGRHLILGQQNCFLSVTTIFIILIASIEALIGIFQLFEIIPYRSNLFKITGTFHNPTPFALLLTISFAFAAAVFFLQKEIPIIIKYLALSCCILIISILPFTSCRASWIGVIVALVTIAYFRALKYRLFTRLHLWKKIAISTLIILAAIICSISLYNFKKDSSDGRFLIWKVSGKMILEHPVLGIGFGMFQSQYNLRQADYFRENPNKKEQRLADNTRMAFNDYIQVFVEVGFVGLLLLFGGIYAIFSCLKLKHDLINVYLCPIVVLLVISLFSYPLNILSTKILLVFFIGIISNIISDTFQHYNLFNIRRWMFFLMLSFSFFISFRYLIKFQKYSVWSYASYQYKIGNCVTSEFYYRQVYDYLKDEPSFSEKYAECLIVNQKYSEALNVLNRVKSIVPNSDLFILMGNIYEKTKQYSDAIMCYEEAGYMVPNKFRPGYLEARLYFEMGDTLKAKTIVNELLKKDIKINSGYVIDVLNEIKLLQRKMTNTSN